MDCCKICKLEDILLVMSGKEKIQEDVLYAEKEAKENEIILYNDDVNTFDHVINTLIYACEHTPEQAEQCSIIVHYKGQCTVKSGSFEELKPRCTMLLEAGLSAEIL
ncbi:Clp protease ClpS [Constantimarinum furrinae]|uniref:Clp protease ClpS n=2 Tax=Constantimarinum furrinae TaxID=2562285 RepID=A0A7G8PR42_9FLAO|nr:Clp protease ClpS [Constantimarinum furrinae]